MDNLTTSENKEALIVLGSTVSTAISAFTAAAPLPLEWKLPVSGLTATITGAVLAYWKLKVNKVSE